MFTKSIYSAIPLPTEEKYLKFKEAIKKYGYKFEHRGASKYFKCHEDNTTEQMVEYMEELAKRDEIRIKTGSWFIRLSAA